MALLLMRYNCQTFISLFDDHFVMVNIIHYFFICAGYSAGSSNKKGSHVWEVLKNTLDEILKQGPVKLLSWLKETNGVLAKSERDINDGRKEIQYKPLLSICHTLTREILFAIDEDPVQMSQSGHC